MPKPIVAVVGRPNVGKSTLFNRLIGRRVAIVEDTPGITRDRLYQPAEWNGRGFILIDTGGILPDESDPLLQQVKAQADVAMAEADVILFMVDTAHGLTPADREIANPLRSATVPVIVVANKADNSRLQNESGEFYGLGLGEVLAISAVHGHNVAELLDLIVQSLPAEQSEAEDSDRIGLAIVGRPNVGKSSLVNAILGEDRAITSPIPGTTRDTIDMPLEWAGTPLMLLDTAGLRRNRKIQGTVEYYMAMRARAGLERSDVGVVVIDGSTGVMDGDKRVTSFANDAGRACIIAVNKWDLVDPGVIRRDGGNARKPDRKLMLAFTAAFRKECPYLAWAPLVFVSATQRFGIRAAMETAIASAQNHAHRIPTGELNRLIREAAEKHPYLESGRELRIYYATMARVRPPTIVLFCNDTSLFHFSYQRYLENQIRKVWPLEGTPIRLLARKVENSDRDAGS
ncbi:MAG: ribosome biogenesis GTPase Der [Armatimonadetes bacterium]|nr:ribosome biogenesis GTPase Der [Armatimonadota bacterium]MDE2205059.1 ribosome biogenesis GTPase Der [Armatimonadota bacterium]